MTDDQRQIIEQACAQFDFPLGGVEQRDEVLQLSPTSVDELPDAGVLTELAEQLEQKGFRYVTFAIPEGEE